MLQFSLFNPGCCCGELECNGFMCNHFFLTESQAGQPVCGGWRQPNPGQGIDVYISGVHRNSCSSAFALPPFNSCYGECSLDYNQCECLDYRVSYFPDCYHPATGTVCPNGERYDLSVDLVGYSGWMAPEQRGWLAGLINQYNTGYSRLCSDPSWFPKGDVSFTVDSSENNMRWDWGKGGNCGGCGWVGDPSDFGDTSSKTFCVHCSGCVLTATINYNAHIARLLTLTPAFATAVVNPFGAPSNAVSIVSTPTDPPALTDCANEAGTVVGSVTLTPGKWTVRSSISITARHRGGDNNFFEFTYSLSCPSQNSYNCTEGCACYTFLSETDLEEFSFWDDPRERYRKMYCDKELSPVGDLNCGTFETYFTNDTLQNVSRCRWQNNGRIAESYSLNGVGEKLYRKFILNCEYEYCCAYTSGWPVQRNTDVYRQSLPNPTKLRLYEFYKRTRDSLDPNDEEEFLNWNYYIWVPKNHNVNVNPITFWRQWHSLGEYDVDHEEDEGKPRIEIVTDEICKTCSDRFVFNVEDSVGPVDDVFIQVSGFVGGMEGWRTYTGNTDIFGRLPIIFVSGQAVNWFYSLSKDCYNTYTDSLDPDRCDNNINITLGRNTSDCFFCDSCEFGTRKNLILNDGIGNITFNYAGSSIWSGCANRNTNVYTYSAGCCSGVSAGTFPLTFEMECVNDGDGNHYDLYIDVPACSGTTSSSVCTNKRRIRSGASCGSLGETDTIGPIVLYENSENLTCYPFSAEFNYDFTFDSNSALFDYYGAGNQIFTVTEA